MKISFFEVRDTERALIEPVLVGHELAFYKEHLDEKSIELAKDSDVVSVFVDSEVRKNIIDLLPNVKMINTRSTGTDHIDINYAKEKGILVSSVPAYGMHTVAEFAFALILALSRKICLAREQTRKSDFSLLPELGGFDLYGKTIGIIGTGKIGKNSILIAKGFNMKILATDLYPDTNFAEENGFEYVPLSILLSASDIVTVHAPYNETTKHLINTENIKTMKKGSILINTARGEIVESKALLNALKEGTISGAGLDVIEGERKMKRGGDLTDEEKQNIEICKEIVTMSNVIVTPHIAFFTKEAETEIIRVVVDNISAFVSSQK